MPIPPDVQIVELSDAAVRRGVMRVTAEISVLAVLSVAAVIGLALSSGRDSFWRSTGGPQLILIPLAAALLPLLAALGWYAWQRAALSSWLRTTPLTDPNVLLPAALDRCSPLLHAFALRQAARRLAEDPARHGTTVYFAPAGEHRPIVPIGVAFEPRPLTPRDAGLRAVMEESAISEPPAARKRPWWAPGTARHEKSSGTLSMVLSTLAGAALLSGAAHGFTGPWILSVLAAGALTAVPFFLERRARSAYLLLNGGVARRWRGTWRPVGRQDGVLIAYRVPFVDGWLAIFAGSQERFELQLNGELGIWLLRAWLSPVPAPAAERWSDFQN